MGGAWQDVRRGDFKQSIFNYFGQARVSRVYTYKYRGRRECNCQGVLRPESEALHSSPKAKYVQRKQKKAAAAKRAYLNDDLYFPRCRN
jgi:hypothetical protein